jgi:hypothetical protein
MKHHEGDGCTGDYRVLDGQDARAINALAMEMVTRYASGDYDGALRAGAVVGRHYGTGGEFLLAVTFAEQITGSTPPRLRDEDGRPRLTLALSLEKDTHLLCMVGVLIQGLAALADTSADQIRAALTAKAVPVEDFIHAVAQCKTGQDRSACRDKWQALYPDEALDSWDASAHLGAMATSALLLGWTARVSVYRVH